MKTLFFYFSLIFPIVGFCQQNNTFGFEALKEAKAKIENTVPLVIRGMKEENLETKSNKYNIDKEILLLDNEYVKVAIQFEKYKGAITDCIQNTRSIKKSIKCINSKSSPLQESLGNYDSYIALLIPKHKEDQCRV